MPIDSGREGHRRLFSATGWLGAVLAVAGAVSLIVGWWGISGESVVALQMSYVASASIPGAAMVIAGAVLLSGESARRNAADSARMISTLYDLLTVATGATPETETAIANHGQTLVVVPGGNRYHRAGCALVEGKRGVTTVDAAAIVDQELQPCPVCNPVPTDP
ncbi:MAG TPA: hypothetical protein VHN36_20230 [Ilumatobacteraceae bacterium]|nr:hypothetical protein [Ilumatobacteraceae bacterium]